MANIHGTYCKGFHHDRSESLLGGFWFLISLFWASIISLLFLNILSRTSLLTENNISGGVILILLATMIWHCIPVALPQMFGEQTLLATTFYMSGYLSRKKNIHFAHPLMTGLLLLMVPAIAAFFIKLNMVTVQGWLVLADYVIAMMGTISIVLLSRELSRHRITSIFTYIGDKTLYILVFHFLAFKLVSFSYIFANNLPIDYLIQFPVIQDANPYMWVIYSVVGICFSLLAWKLFLVVQYMQTRMK